jgi:hypothetical protein
MENTSATRSTTIRRQGAAVDKFNFVGHERETHLSALRETRQGRRLMDVRVTRARFADFVRLEQERCGYMREQRAGDERWAAPTKVTARRRIEWHGVYFVQWGSFIKIGYGWNVERRRRQITCTIPEGDVTGMGWIWLRQAGQLESYEQFLHQKFAAHRVRGEWFHDCPEIRAFIYDNCLPWPETVDESE